METTTTAEPQVEATTEESKPKLAIPPNFEGPATLTFPSGATVTFTSKMTTKGKEENRWAYPSMVDAPEIKALAELESKLAAYTSIIGENRVVEILEDELDATAQYFWRHTSGNWDEFSKTFIEGKKSREVVNPQKLMKLAMDTHKKAVEAKKAGNMELYQQLKAEAVELKNKANELFAKDWSEDE